MPPSKTFPGVHCSILKAWQYIKTTGRKQNTTVKNWRERKVTKYPTVH